VVQPAIDQEAKIDTEADRSAIFEKHLALSAQVRRTVAEPDIIVWPETSIPFILTDNQTR